MTSKKGTTGKFRIRKEELGFGGQTAVLSVYLFAHSQKREEIGQYFYGKIRNVIFDTQEQSTLCTTLLPKEPRKDFKRNLM